MNDCIFCKIINKEIPSYKIYEDDIVYAFLDLSQSTKGHTLLIPKKHVKDIFEYDDLLAREVFQRIPKIARALEKAFPDMQGLNILNNNREMAYQSVFHSHIHLIPRYSKNDNFSITFGKNKYSDQQMQEIARKIAKEVQ